MEDRTEMRVGLFLVAVIGAIGFVGDQLTEKPLDNATKPTRFEMAVIGYFDQQTSTLSFSEPMDFEFVFTSKMPSFYKGKVSTDLEVVGLYLPGTREYDAALQKSLATAPTPEKVAASMRETLERIDPIGRPSLPVEILQGNSFATAEPK